MANRYGPFGGPAAEAWATSLRSPVNSTHRNAKETTEKNSVNFRKKGKKKSFDIDVNIVDMMDTLQGLAKKERAIESKRQLQKNTSLIGDKAKDRSEAVSARKFGTHFALRIITADRYRNLCNEKYCDEQKERGTKCDTLIPDSGKAEDVAGVIHMKQSSNTVIYHQLSFSENDSGKRKGETEIFRFTPDISYGFNKSDNDIYVESIQPVVLSTVKGQDSTVLFLSENKSKSSFAQCEGPMISLAAKTIFNALNLVCLSKRSTSHVATTICISWVVLHGEKLYDVLKVATNASHKCRTRKQPPSPSFESIEGDTINQVNLHLSNEGGLVCLTNMVEVKLESSSDAEQIVSRVSELYKQDDNDASRNVNWISGHSIVTIRVDVEEGSNSKSLSINSEFNEKGRLRFLVLDPAADNMKNLSAVLEGLEMEIPAVPFHKSKITMLMKDPLYGNENLVVLGTVSCEKHEIDQDFDQNTLQQPETETVGIVKSEQSDCVLSTFGLVAHIQQVCQGYYFNDEVSTPSSLSLSPTLNDGEKISSIQTAALFDDHDGNVTIEYMRSIAALIQHMCGTENEGVKWFSTVITAFETLKTDSDKLKLNFERIETDNYALLTQNNELKELVKATKEELKQLKAEASCLKKERDTRPEVPSSSLDTSTSPKSSKVEYLKQHLKESQAEIQDYKIYKDVMETAVVRIKDEMSKLSKENRKYQDQVPRLQQRLKRDSLTLKLQARKIEELKAKMVESLEAEQTIKQALLKEREQNQKISKENIIRIKDQKHELEELKLKYKRLEIEGEALSGQNEDLKQIVKLAKEELKQSKVNTVHLKQENETELERSFSNSEECMEDSPKRNMHPVDPDSFTSDLLTKLKSKRESKLHPILAKKPAWGAGPGLQRLKKVT